uniref:Transcription termination factor n=1 Tax=Candidatus Actinomarina minuta TaxID=1389454 RepID=S5DS82_9ACTN|nr:transcription termination factor [Candidatus Actinomarina minuta]
MRLDFRHYTFNSIFRLDDYSDNIVLIDNDLEQNQLLRANQLIQHTNVNIENILHILGNSAENWTISRIGKAERSALILGISELLLNLTPHKVIVAEWTKIVDKHSSSDGAKFVNAILDNVSKNYDVN